MKTVLIGMMALVYAIFGTERELVIAPQIIAEISQRYQRDSTVEQAYCLYGTQTPDKIVINAMMVPELKEQTANDVEFAEPCQPAFVYNIGAVQYLGVLHTHHGDKPRDSTLSFQMTPPELQGLSCSHYYIFSSGDYSKIPVTDYFAFELDSAATVSLIYCGNKIAMLDRRYIDDSNHYVETVYKTPVLK